jgi:hypothetical protein
MKAFFTHAEDARLGLRFEPETFEEQLLLSAAQRRRLVKKCAAYLRHATNG